MNKFVKLEPFFGELEGAVNIRMVSNRGVLTWLQTKAEGAWAERFRAMGFRLPYALGCAVRFLMKPRPEVQELFHSIELQLRTPPPTGRGERRRGVATLGIHIRVKDAVVWEGDRGAPKELSAEMVQKLVGSASRWLHCARRVESYWFPSSLTVRWMLITNSAQLKAALKSDFPDKVITTDFIPRHSNSLSSDSPGSHGNSSARRLGAIAEEQQDEEKRERERLFQEVVTEWLLLASCDAYIISRSGYSSTAVYYAKRPMAAFDTDNCDPEMPLQAVYNPGQARGRV
ncbi:hypothetical protein CLOM_g5572 [Closterium sp. NIES-68]|nr:hypothetical protein CLOM_g5572 [Closterium sp. NIES-68]GJP71690.1 hypothetical protein CLOP_g2498 [Closterium sp. NIES-67]